MRRYLFAVEKRWFALATKESRAEDHWEIVLSGLGKRPVIEVIEGVYSWSIREVNCASSGIKEGQSSSVL